MDLNDYRVRSIRLTRPLGRGGVGEVWLGIDENLDRRVAVKVLRRDRRLDKRARTRFLREARILARIEHPNICRAIDYVGGDDLDFLILELVDGITLREALREGLGHHEVLDFAEQIASALAAAHAVSVIHRDLKPSNVMITTDGQVKILDFGLARTAEPDGEPSSADSVSIGAENSSDFTVTRLGEIKGTPRYMSPEQARGETVTAASDVYSFGLVLQAMMTGKHPFGDEDQLEVLLQRASWGDRDPVDRGPRALAQLVDRTTDLNPANRPTAAEVRDRLHWIRATPKRRLRRAVAAGAALVLAVATLVSVAGFVRARAAQADAERSAREARTAQADAEAVSTFLSDMLASADPTELGRDVMVVDVLDRAADGLDTKFADQPLRRAALLDTLGVTYHALGLDREAEDQLTKALELRTEELGADTVETLSTGVHLGEVLATEDRQEEAEEQLLTVLASSRGRLGSDHPLTIAAEGIMAEVLYRQRRFEEAAATAQRVLDARTRTLPAGDPDLLATRVTVGRMERGLQHWERAEDVLSSVVTDARRALGEDHPVTISAIGSLASLYDVMERYDEAVGITREACDLAEKILGPDHPHTLQSELNLAIQLIRAGKNEEAVTVLKPLTARQERVLGPVHRTHLEGLRSLSFALGELGRVDESLELMRRRWELSRRTLGEEHRVTLQAKSGWAATLAWAGRRAEAETIYREVLETRRRVFGEDHEATRRSVAALARLLRSTGREAEAAALPGE